MAKSRPRCTDDEMQILLEYRAIRHASENADINYKDVKHGWLKSDKASLFFNNPDFEKPEFDPDKIDWKFVTKGISKLPDIERCEARSGLFDRVVYTDTHVGMDPNPTGYSLYGGKWGEKELEDRLKQMINHIVSNQKSDTLILTDLGDFFDGWDGQTARKGQDLPQNMDNQKSFDVGLWFKWEMITILRGYYSSIEVHNVCESNHGGSFDYLVNSALSAMVNSAIDSGVEVFNHRKFMNHHTIEGYTFILSHGKDSTNMKFGFKPQLDKAQMEKIDNYIDANYLLQPNVKIEFSKGDSHQMLLDWSGSDRFNYFNYPAFSPSSSWIQTNFKKGVSGFVMFNYLNSEDVLVKPKFFKWEE